jgi:hypothetical protein
LLCLISDEHSTNLVWKDEKQHAVENRDEESLAYSDRLYTFSIEETNEEEETAVAQAGFFVRDNVVNRAYINVSNSSLTRR